MALVRKSFLFAGNHDAAVRAAIVYSLFSSCKAASIEPREWLEDILEISCLFEGWPLFVPGILRDGVMTPPYIAGKAHGLSLIQKN